MFAKKKLNLFKRNLLYAIKKWREKQLNKLHLSLLLPLSQQTSKNHNIYSAVQSCEHCKTFADLTNQIPRSSQTMQPFPEICYFLVHKKTMVLDNGFHFYCPSLCLCIQHTSKTIEKGSTFVHIAWRFCGHATSSLLNLFWYTKWYFFQIFNWLSTHWS